MLRDLVESAQSGNGAVVLIAGEAGLGKTTLLAQLGYEAVNRDMLVLSGRCHGLSASPPFGPWHNALDTLVPNWNVSGSDEQRWIVESIRLHAAIRPVVILLDDLHWADYSSHDMLRRPNYTDVFPVCAFPVQYHEEGTISISLHVDKHGDPRFDVAHADLAITWTNLTTGMSLTGTQRVGAKTRYDGDVVLTEFHGLVYRFVMPGHGTVVINAGHFSFDRATGAISLVRGNLTFLDGDYQDLCSVLAGD